MQIKRKKRLIISLLLTLVIMLLISPLYSDANMENFSRALNSKEGRINIFFGGDKDNQLQVVDLSKRVRSEQPEWYNNPSWIKTPGRGTMVQAKIYRQFRKYELQYKALGNGTVSIHLLGPHNRWNNGKIYPVWVYYKNFKVNGKEIFSDTKKLSYEKGYKYDIPLKHGDLLKIEFEAKRHIPLNLISGIEPLLFISCLAISFLLSRMLVYWLSQFKIKEHHSRIDIVFLSVFFALLLIPMSHINQDEKSSQENRMLAKYIPLIDNQGHLNLKYGKNFEAWFNDRFNARDSLVLLHSLIKIILYNTYYNNIGIAFSNKIMFFWSNLKIKPLNSTEIKNANKGLLSLEQFCKDNSIECYIEIIPPKYAFFAQYLQNTPYAQDYYPEKTTLESIKQIEKGTYFNIIYPLSEMLKAEKTDRTFFKTDHHWTEWGAYIGYKAFIQEVQKKFPEIKPIKESDFDNFYSHRVRAEFGRNFEKGSICSVLSLPETFCLEKNVVYKYYEHKDKKNLYVKQLPKLKQDSIYSKAINKKFVVIGNSSNENFMQFLPYTFRYTKKIRLNVNPDNNLKLSRWKKEIIEYKPDILLVIIHTEYNLSRLSELAE